MRRQLMQAALLVSALILPAAGCGTGPYKTAPVSGRVTLDGKPLRGATVAFSRAVPDGMKAPPAAQGVTDDDGSYTLKVYDDDRSWDGAWVGDNRVTITLDERDTSKNVHGGALRELVPARYNSDTELQVTVPASGKADMDFQLKSEPPSRAQRR